MKGMYNEAEEKEFEEESIEVVRPKVDSMIKLLVVCLVMMTIVGLVSILAFCFEWYEAAMIIMVGGGVFNVIIGLFGIIAFIIDPELLD